MDKWSILRSVNHQDAGHSSGDQLCFTGYLSEGDPDTNSKPSCARVPGAESEWVADVDLLSRVTCVKSTKPRLKRFGRCDMEKLHSLRRGVA